MHPDVSNARGWLLLPKQIPGGHALKPKGFWDQTSCNPQAKLKLPAQPSSSYCRQHLQAHPGERVDCRLQDQGSLQQAEDANSRAQDLKPVLGVASTCNLAVWSGSGFSCLDCTLTLFRFGPSFVVYPNPG